MKISKLINLFNGHVLKWPRYYSKGAGGGGGGEKKKKKKKKGRFFYFFKKNKKKKNPRPGPGRVRFFQYWIPVLTLVVPSKKEKGKKTTTY
jgi:hypothetical protein